MRKLKFGFIGGGRIADMHAPAYMNNERAEIYAVCDINEEVAKRRMKEWNCTKYYTNYLDMLEDKEIDAVEIITPHHLHRQMVIDAARAKKHISVQKPMAMNVKECDDMISACKKEGVKLKVFENFVFYPPYVKAKELIEQGEIGEPLTIRLKLGSCGKGGWWTPLTTWVWRLNYSECGGGPAIFDDGYHKFSTALYLFGDVEKVYAWIDRSFVYIDEPAMILWKYKDSEKYGYFEATLSPHITCRSKYYSADERVEIVGEKGVIWITRCTGKLLDIAPLILYKDGKTIYFENIRCDWLDSFWDGTEHFIDCILYDKEPRLTGEQGKKVMQFAIASYISARENREVRPDEITGEERCL